MNKKTRKILLVLVIILIIPVIYSAFEKPIYGNTPETIKASIHSIEGYEAGSIDIVDMMDIGDSRFVALLYDNQPAVAQFTKNEKGNYRWSSIERRDQETLNAFTLTSFDDSKLKVVIVKNNTNSAAKVVVSINGQKIEQEMPVNEMSATWIDVPESKDGRYEFHYSYFDEDGQLID